MDNVQQINVRNLFRSVLGRVGRYRALRVKPIYGTIVGFPKAPLNELGLRNLLRRATDFDIDDKPSLNIYISDAAESNTAYVPKEAHLNKYRYFNSLFVLVEDEDGEEKVCFHITGFGVIETDGDDDDEENL